jgi:uncharacterized protein (DUF302 family)
MKMDSNHMFYQVESDKPFAQAAVDLEAAVKENGFGVLHVHDLGAMLRAKGQAFVGECKIFEVCNPAQAARVLQADVRLNMALPCRISVFTTRGKTVIGFIRPRQILATLSPDPTLAVVAGEVETTLVRIADEAR